MNQLTRRPRPSKVVPNWLLIVFFAVVFAVGWLLWDGLKWVWNLRDVRLIP
jgi:hypothetical protein